MIDLNVTSANSPDYTIKQLLAHQLALIHVDSSILELFSKDMPLMNDLITTNLHLAFCVERSVTIADITNAIQILRDSMTLVSKRLRIYQRSTYTATPKNIFLNKVHSAYGIFIIEFNSLITREEDSLHMKRVNTNSLAHLVNMPYEPTSHDSVPPMPHLERHKPYRTPYPSKEDLDKIEKIEQVMDDCCCVNHYPFMNTPTSKNKKTIHPTQDK